MVCTSNKINLFSRLGPDLTRSYSRIYKLLLSAAKEDRSSHHASVALVLICNTQSPRVHLPSYISFNKISSSLTYTLAFAVQISFPEDANSRIFK